MPESEKGKLIQSLREAEHPAIELRGTEGGALLFLPFGARVLGLFAEEEGPNLFWADPRMARTAEAAQVFSSPEWVNIGGERTWISPEIDVCVEDLFNPWGSYKVPYSMDPGRYVVEKLGGAIKASASIHVPICRRRTTCDVILEKTIRTIPNPLRGEARLRERFTEVRYIGYELTTSLQLAATPDPTVQVGAWNIIALPAGGEMSIPTLTRAFVRSYLGSLEAGYLSVDERFVRLRIDGRKQYKVGVRAISLVGRAGYLRPLEDDRWALVVRNFSVNPSGEYVDPPWDNLDDLGYAFQAYNDDGQLGTFGELEYHVPAIGGRTGLTGSWDCSQVWAFSGPEEPIRTIAGLLLGVESFPRR